VIEDRRLKRSWLVKTEAFVAEEAAKWKKSKGVSTKEDSAEGINEKKRCYYFTVDVAEEGPF